MARELREWLDQYIEHLPAPGREAEERQKAEAEAAKRNLAAAWAEFRERAFDLFFETATRLGVGRVAGQEGFVELKVTEECSLLIEQPLGLAPSLNLLPGWDEMPDIRILINLPPRTRLIHMVRSVEELDDHALQALLKDFLQDERCKQAVAWGRKVKQAGQ